MSSISGGGLDPGHTNPTYDSDEDGLIDNADQVDGTDAAGLQEQLSGARVSLGGQTVPSGSAQRIEFDTVSYDTNNEFDTENHEFVADNDGIHIFHVVIEWGPDSGWSTGDSTTITFRRKPSNSAFSSQEMAFDDPKVGDGTQSVSGFGTIDLSAGDSVFAQVEQNSGSSKDIWGGEDVSAMSINYVG